MTAVSLFDILCIRADAGTQMGVGHVMRCLALAQVWLAQGGKVILVTCNLNPLLRGRLEVEGVIVRSLQSSMASPADAGETVEFARAAGASWLVLDGYHFGEEYRATVKKARLKLLVIDDTAAGEFSAANVVLNQNINAHDRMYADSAGQAILLLGSRYALLRQEFLACRSTPRTGHASARRILLTFGGGDAANVTQRMADLLAHAIPGRLHLTIILGATNPHAASLQANLSAIQQKHDVELLINPPNLPEIMNQTDLAISAAGSTCWELACLGVPTLVVVIAELQQTIAERMHELGVAILLGRPEEALAEHGVRQISSVFADTRKQRSLSEKAHQLIDGQGSRRVVEALAAHPLRLRLAGPDDMKPVWEWANDPATRQASFNSAPISWDDHRDWFQRLLNDRSVNAAYLAEDVQGQAVGFLRFARDAECAEMSLNLAPTARGQGWGAKMVRFGAFLAVTDGFCAEVRGWVKTSNLASLAAFRRAGFSESASKNHRGTEAVEFRWDTRNSAGTVATHTPSLSQ